MERSNWETIFNQHKDGDLIHRRNLAKALSECGKVLSEAEITKECNNSSITFEEFATVILKHTTMEEWAETLSLSQMLASSISTRLGANDIGALRSLNSEDLEGVVMDFGRNVFEKCITALSLLNFNPLQCVKPDLNYSVQTVQDGAVSVFHELSTDNRREQIESGVPYSKGPVQSFLGGTVSDFYLSLPDSLGWPKLDFFDAMEIEHENGESFQDQQDAKIEISPKIEFQSVVNGVTPQEKDGREMPKIENLLCSQTSKNAKLRREEVIAVVLYTGPMFHAYNTVLRKRLHFSGIDRSEADSERQYVTTIFVIASAIVKLTRVQRIESGLKVYRGLGGDVQFPRPSDKADGRGCKGHTEPAFMSTTRNWNTAIRYSGVKKKEKPLPFVLEIYVRSVDRGADIKEFSQYRHEDEYHWAPGCFLEPIGTREVETNFGALTVVEVRVNCNLKNMTIDELLSLRKDLHLQAFSLLVNDVKHSLKGYMAQVEERLASDKTLNYDEEGNWAGKPICTAEEFIKKVLDQCEEVRSRHKDIKADEYAEAGKYRELVLTMLETPAMAKSKLLGWIEDRKRSICLDFASPLRTCHRERISFLLRNLSSDREKRKERAETLCIEMGLAVTTACEKNELGEPRLFEAAAAGRSERDLQLLLDAKADIRDVDKEGSSPLFVAARNGHINIIETLFKAKADVNVLNHKGQTPAWIAARNGQRPCLDLLIKLHADVNIVDRDGASPAMVAAQRGRHQILELLLQEGANSNAREELGCTAAFLAAHSGHARCIDVLEKAGADLTLANDTGHTPLMMAAQEGHQVCVQRLIAVAEAKAAASGAAGDDAVAWLDAVNEDGQTAVFAAAEAGHAGCIELLHEARADLTRSDRAGLTPAMIAEHKEKAECVELLRRLASEPRQVPDAGRGRGDDAESRAASCQAGDALADGPSAGGPE